MIEISGISKSYKEGLTRKRVQALTDLSLQVRPGEVFGFLGPNGAGKSTTIKILVNLVFPDRGSVTLFGQPPGSKAVQHRIGFLPENPYFYDYLTAEELLWFAGTSCGMERAAIRRRSAELFELVDLTAAARRPLRTYSKGMVQRAGLAAALVHDPDLVILDEPMSGLDPIGRKMVGDIILDLKAQGKTVFFSSHILTDIERFSDRIGILDEGKLLLSGALEDIVTGDLSLEDVFMEQVLAAGKEGQR
jgi:ABC-2 type transport system ATP-binding protein